MNKQNQSYRSFLFKIQRNRLFRRIVKKLYGEIELYKLDQKIEMLKTPCLLKMSDATRTLPVLCDGEIKNSECAKKFHERLREATDMQAVASLVYEFGRDIHVVIWLDDSEGSKKALKKVFKCPCANNVEFSSPLFRQTIDALRESVLEFDKESCERITDLSAKQQKALAGGNEDERYCLSICLYSYMDQYRHTVLEDSSEKINEMIEKCYPGYDRIECVSPNHYMTGNDIQHEFMFFTPEQQKRAESNGEYDKMRLEAYEIMSRYDIMNHISYEKYKPLCTNRRMYPAGLLYMKSRYPCAIRF